MVLPFEGFLFALEVDFHLALNLPAIIWKPYLLEDKIESVGALLCQKIALSLEAWDFTQVFFFALKKLLIFPVWRVFGLYLLIEKLNGDAFQ